MKINMNDIMTCPKCGSTTDLITERRPNGFTKCKNCGFSGLSSEFRPLTEKELLTTVTHDDIRKELSVWSRSARQTMRLYITQQEAKELKLKQEISTLKTTITRLQKKLASPVET